MIASASKCRGETIRPVSPLSLAVAHFPTYQQHHPPLSRELHCIAEQVDQHLPQLAFISVYQQGLHNTIDRCPAELDVLRLEHQTLDRPRPDLYPVTLAIHHNIPLQPF